MKLTTLKLRNFRCYQDEIKIDFEDITTLVGRNDSGKSTIMEALDLFLNESNPDKHDACISGDAKDLAITCEFNDLPEEIIIDDAYPTTFEEEHLLNANGNLEIQKIYSGQLANPKCSNIYAIALHPTVDGVSNLLQLKNPALKKKAKELGIDLTDVDQKVNAQLRNKIRQHFGNLQIAPATIPLNEENAKKIWDSLKTYLPAYALFKSDRSSSDQDPEAQDPLKAAIKEAIKQREADLKAIAEHVEGEVKKIAHKTLEKLSEMDPSLASQLNPQFTPPKWESLFKASITGDDDIPINKRGSGVKRLILLNFFRAKAEQLAIEKGRQEIIYAIEEPETSQHPNNQRLLLRALSDLSIESQVIISTHTPMLARSLPDNNLRYVHVHEDKRREILVGGGETNELFSKALGILPDNNVKLFIGVEGKHDISFFRGLSKALLKSGVDVIDLEKMEQEGEIIFFPLGGSNLALWTSRLENLNRPEFHIFDRDTAPPAPPKYQAAADEINERENCIAKICSKNEIENYLHKTAIEQAYNHIGIEITVSHNFQPYDDVPEEIGKLVHTASGSETPWEELSEKKKKKKIGRAKSNLNSLAPLFMSNELLGEIDTEGDVIGWFENMRALIK
jgi:putative ATP-dependent endonuclease of the OLD family